MIEVMKLFREKYRRNPAEAAWLQEDGGVFVNYYERALELNDEIVANRRYIHTSAEVGLDTPRTRAYVVEN